MKVSKRWTSLTRGFAIAVLVTGVSGLAAQAPAQAANGSTIYKAPSGLFDVAVPAGWTASWDEQLNQVTLRHQSTMASVMALTMPNETSAYAKTFLGMTRDEFSGQCKSSDELEHGPARLAGLDAQSFLVRCPEAPASVAGSTVAWAGNKVLLAFVLIAPIRTYGDDVAVLDAIETSVHLTGTPVIAAVAPTEDTRVAEVKRACKAGSFIQEECARRVGQAMSTASGAPGTDHAPIGTRFESADGSFSVEVPAGWQAAQKEKDGVKGVQLRRGSNWINLMPAPAGANTASEVVLRFETRMAGENGPKAPIGKVGIVQLFGHGLEVAYDTFPSQTVDKVSVESTVAGIGDISGSGPKVLMITSIAKGEDTVSLAVAQSIRVGK